MCIPTWSVGDAECGVAECGVASPSPLRASERCVYGNHKAITIKTHLRCLYLVIALLTPHSASPTLHVGIHMKTGLRPSDTMCCRRGCAGAMYSAPTEGCGVRADAPHCVYGRMVARATAEPLNLPKPHEYSWGLHPIHIRSTVERLHLSRCQMQPFHGCYFMLCRNPTNNRGALVDNTVPRYYWDRAGEFMWD